MHASRLDAVVEAERYVSLFILIDVSGVGKGHTEVARVVVDIAFDQELAARGGGVESAV